MPHSDYLEVMTLDDRVGMAASPLLTSEPHPRAELSFKLAGKLLTEAGFHVHPTKAVRAAKHAVQLGMELRGDIPSVEAERFRRCNLAAVSLTMSGAGRTCTTLMQMLNSSWSHCLGVCRPLFSLLEHSYWAASAEVPDLSVRPLSAGARSEL